jgi:HEPN domain-containing protein
MPLRRRAPGTPQEWLARAKSNLEMARREKTEEVFWEDLCFEAQQAAEKALKAVLQSGAIRFRYVHSLEELITTLERHNIAVSERVKEAVVLTQYALETRYPGDFEAVTEAEYLRALDLAEQVVSWAEKILPTQGKE